MSKYTDKNKNYKNIFTENIKNQIITVSTKVTKTPISAESP